MAVTLECLDCNAPDTPIDTPEGPRPIWRLQPGDLVYSVHQGQLAIVPIRDVRTKPQYDHHVMGVVLQSGATLNISPNHPTASGLPLGLIKSGDLLEGEKVLCNRLVPFTDSHTYDILPESDSGDYFAAGVQLRSTLSGATASKATLTK